MLSVECIQSRSRAEAGGMQIGCGALQVHASSTRHSGCFEAWKLGRSPRKTKTASTHAEVRRLYNGKDKLRKSHIDALASRAIRRKLTHCYPVRKAPNGGVRVPWPFLACSKNPLSPIHTRSNSKHPKYPLLPYQHQDSIPRTVHPMDAAKLQPPHNCAGLALAHRADRA